LRSPISLTQKTKKPTNQKFGELRLFKTPKSRALNLSSHTIPHMQKHMKNYEKNETFMKAF
jgi:hypothetical protein